MRIRILFPVALSILALTLTVQAQRLKGDVTKEQCLSMQETWGDRIEPYCYDALGVTQRLTMFKLMLRDRSVSAGYKDNIPVVVQYESQESGPFSPGVALKRYQMGTYVPEYQVLIGQGYLEKNLATLEFTALSIACSIKTISTQKNSGRKEWYVILHRYHPAQQCVHEMLGNEIYRELLKKTFAREEPPESIDLLTQFLLGGYPETFPNNIVP